MIGLDPGRGNHERYNPLVPSPAPPRPAGVLKRCKRSLLRWLGIHLLGGLLLPLLFRTWRIDYDDRHGLLPAVRDGSRFLFVFWHNRQLFFLPAFREVVGSVRVLVSQHADGEVLVRILHRFGVGAVRGSSTRGGAAALRALVRAARQGPLGITPDGPLGPRYELKPGAILAASLSGLPIVLLAASADRAWQFGSWDRFLLPKPWARVRLRSDAPVEVPGKLTAEEIEELRGRFERRLKELTVELDRGMEREVDPLLTASESDPA